MNSALLVAGIVFGIVGVVHFSRLIYKFEIVIAGKSVPLWVNALGCVVALSLSVWMFVAYAASAG